MAVSRSSGHAHTCTCCDVLDPCTVTNIDAHTYVVCMHTLTHSHIYTHTCTCCNVLDPCTVTNVDAHTYML